MNKTIKQLESRQNWSDFHFYSIRGDPKNAHWETEKRPHSKITAGTEMHIKTTRKENTLWY